MKARKINIRNYKIWKFNLSTSSKKILLKLNSEEVLRRYGFPTSEAKFFANKKVEGVRFGADQFQIMAFNKNLSLEGIGRKTWVVRVGVEAEFVN